MAAGASSKLKICKTMVVTCSHLPDELWERIIKLVNGDNPTLKSLSFVSKPFLSITNHVRFSAIISYETTPFLQHLFQRFPNLTSLNLTHFFIKEDLNTLLTKISTFPLNLKSLTISNQYTIPTSGLRALSKKMKNLTSLTCSKITFIRRYDLLVIVDCFPSLEELVLMAERSCTYYNATRNFGFVLDDHNQFLALPKLRKIRLYGIFVRSQFINYLRTSRGPFTKEKNKLDHIDTA